MTRRLRRALCLVLLISGPTSALAAEPLLVAPMLEGLYMCPASVEAKETEYQSRADCRAKNQDSAPYIEAALARVGPRLSPSKEFELGYTLSIPLLDAFSSHDTGWEIDPAKVAWALRPLSELDRSVVVELMSDHFETGDNLELRRDLMADPSNLMWLPSGPMTPDKYFAAEVIPWTLANQKAPITQFRQKAVEAYAQAICALPEAARKHIRAVSVLGETHQMWPNFFTGMGYGGSFQVADYSPPSIAAFKHWLQTRFGDIAHFNAFAGSNYGSFDDISPPTKDIRTERLNSFQDTFDAYANGVVPIIGWAHDADGGAIDISVYLDGALQDTVPARENRLDVSEAKPSFGTPLVGFRYDLDYSKFPPGIHTLELVARGVGHRPVHFVREPIVIIDRQQSPSQPIPSYAPPDADEVATWPQLEVNLDLPPPSTSLFYNPLARLWSEFRNDQVRTYIEGFADIVANSCIGRDRVYSHQMTPRFYGSWNPERMAVDGSLEPNSHYRTGITLYGGAAWSDETIDWLQATGRTHYGIGELNPVVALSEPALLDIFDKHRRAGAEYLAPYFITIAPPEARHPVNDHDQRFQIDPAASNPANRAFYHALQTLMTRE